MMYFPLAAPAGFALVKKVPGTLHFGARSEGHSFDHTWMNLTHVVHSFYFGSRPTPKKYYSLQKLHPAGLSPDWSDKLHDQQFVSEHTQSTHEHYLQVWRPGGARARARGTSLGGVGVQVFCAIQRRCLCVMCVWGGGRTCVLKEESVCVCDLMPCGTSYVDVCV